MDTSVKRTGKLIYGKFNQLIYPNIGVALATALITCVDSLVAGHFFGITALGAIALSAPFLTLDHALNFVLGNGVEHQVSQAVGKGDRKGADRITAATLTAVVAGYVLVFGLVLLFLDAFLFIFSDDPVLVSSTKQYLIPRILAMPFFEAMLCLEKTYRIDGRPKLFAVRPVVTGILNILLDLLFVVVLKTDIYGISLSFILSTLVGYMVTLSHGFTKRCSIRPDFSVILSPKECWIYWKENLLRGGFIFIDTIANTGLKFLMNVLLSAVGGVQALAIWNVVMQSNVISNGCVEGVLSGTNLYGAALYGEEDFTGLKFLARRSLRDSVIIGCIFMGLFLFFSRPYCMLFGLTGETLDYATNYFRWFSILEPIGAFVCFFEQYVMIVNRYKLAYLTVITEKITALICILAAPLLGEAALLVSYNFGCSIQFPYYIYVLVKDGNWLLPKTEENVFTDYSVCLLPDQISKVSRDVRRIASENGYSEKTANEIAILLEDGLGMIRAKNPEKKTDADIRICPKEDKLILCITDNGNTYDMYTAWTEVTEPGVLESMVVTKMADEVIYDRILELNHLVIKLKTEL